MNNDTASDYQAYITPAPNTLFHW